MAWRRSGDKPLSEPMVAQFTDAYKQGINFDNFVAKETIVFLMDRKIPWLTATVHDSYGYDINLSHK